MSLINSENRFFVSLRMGPTASISYLIGDANGIAQTLYAGSNGLGGSSWTIKTPAVVELLTEVNDIIVGLSRYNSFFIRKIRVYIPDGVDSPTTQQKLTFDAFRIHSAKPNGLTKVKYIPFTQLYASENEQDRIFDIEVNMLFDEFSAISIDTPSLANNWVDTTSIPLARIEFELLGMAEKNKFTTENAA